MKQPVLRGQQLKMKTELRELFSDLWFEIYPGEVTGVIGLDLEGKTALTDLLIGDRAADEGIFYFGERRLSPQEAAQPLREQVEYVGPQDILCYNLSIYENLYVLGRPRRKGPGGWFADRNEHWEEAVTGLKIAGIQANPDDPAGSVNDDERHRLEFLRALISGNPFIVFNSPLKRADFVLDQEKFAVLLDYARTKEVGIIMMINSIDNLIRYCDHASVVRNGRTVRMMQRADFDQLQIRRFLGEEIQSGVYRKKNGSDHLPGRHEPSGRAETSGYIKPDVIRQKRCVLELHEISTETNMISRFNLRVFAGEVTGIVSRDDEWNGWFANFLTGAYAWTQGAVLRNGVSVSRSFLQNYATDRNRTLILHSEENLNLLPLMNMVDNVLLPVQNRIGHFLLPTGEDIKSYILNELLECGLISSPEEAELPVEALSMEQKLRIWQIRARLFRPELMIFAGLYDSFAGPSLQLLDTFVRELSEAGTGVLLIAASSNRLPGVADTICLVRDGMIITSPE